MVKETNGFKLIKTVHLWVTVIILIIGIGINIGLSLSKIGEIEKKVDLMDKRVELLEKGRIDNAENIKLMRIYISEIKFNLKLYLEKEGMQYKEFEDIKEK